jgi:hypothetical protein
MKSNNICKTIERNVPSADFKIMARSLYGDHRSGGPHLLRPHHGDYILMCTKIENQAATAQAIRAEHIDLVEPLQSRSYQPRKRIDYMDLESIRHMYV